MTDANQPDTITLSGDRIDRVQQGLDVARHQIGLGQHETADSRMEDALVNAEGEVNMARADVADAVDDIHDDREVAGEVERKRQKARPASSSV
jgi:hypothetical protein